MILCDVLNCSKKTKNKKTLNNGRYGMLKRRREVNKEEKHQILCDSQDAPTSAFTSSTITSSEVVFRKVVVLMLVLLTPYIGN